MKKRYVLAFLTIGALLVASGCATISRGTKGNVSVSSTPSGAQILLDGQRVGTTPQTITVSRSGNHQLQIELNGYRPYTINLTHRVSVGWTIGSFLLGGIPSIIVDAVTGAIYTIEPNPINADLDETSYNFQDGKLNIKLALNPNTEGMVKIGQLIPSAQ